MGVDRNYGGRIMRTKIYCGGFFYERTPQCLYGGSLEEPLAGFEHRRLVKITKYSLQRLHFAISNTLEI